MRMPAAAMALDLGLDHFAGQRHRQIDRPGGPGGDALAVMAQPLDGQPHSAASSWVIRKPPDCRFQ